MPVFSREDVAHAEESVREAGFAVIRNALIIPDHDKSVLGESEGGIHE